MYIVFSYRSSKQDSQKEHTYEEEKAICRALINYLSRLTGTSAPLIGEGSPSPVPSAGNSPCELHVHMCV